MKFLSMVRVQETGQLPSERLMQEMGKLMEEMIRAGKLVSTAGLMPSAQGKRMRSKFGKLSVTDGPFTETKEIVGGFAVLEAKDMDEAMALTKRFLEAHGDEWDVECEVRAFQGPDFACQPPA